MASQRRHGSDRRAGLVGTHDECTPGPLHWRQRDHQLSVLPTGSTARYRPVRANRGATQVRPLPAEVTILHGDIRDPASVQQALGGQEFDVVVNWVAFTPDHVEADIERFRGRIGQYVFISSASAYQAPPARVPGHRVHPAEQSVLAVLPKQYRL